jgi:DNA-binding Lrp family transcriptional regulator
LSLSNLQKQLCTILQQGIPVCEKPFAEIAVSLGVNQALEQIRRLKKDGIIRRFRAIINHRSLGKASTLAAAHVPEDKLHDVTESVNALSGVSHNYIREHFYNLWFTLQAQTKEEIEDILSGLHKQFSIEFHSLPVVRTFKLNVQFNISDNEKSPENKTIPKPKDKATKLNEKEKYILSNLQNEIEIIEKPFSFLCNAELEIKEVLRIISKLVEKEVIRRIAAVIDYRQLGFNANVLFACEVPEENIIETGEHLASLQIVSHCYQRKTFDEWPYNLFAMLHAQNMDEIKEKVTEFSKTEKITSYQLLPTISELKKEPVQHKFQ